MEAVFDTLKIYERLKGADLPESAAKEITEVFKEVIDERLVTRQYLDLRLKELESSIKNDIIKWVAAMLIAQAALISALVKLL
ncbi:MAG: DUF1640 domain-containing protein [Nitrospirae bacterium]|nr:DUF1640 domain-containing protein [Nitrospirota bacterium]